MDGSILMIAFGVVLLNVGARMARRALAARTGLDSWKGKLIVAGSTFALGVTWVLSRGELQIATAWASSACIVGFSVGSIIEILEARRLKIR